MTRSIISDMQPFTVSYNFSADVSLSDIQELMKKRILQIDKENLTVSTTTTCLPLLLPTATTATAAAAAATASYTTTICLLLPNARFHH